MLLACIGKFKRNLQVQVHGTGGWKSENREVTGSHMIEDSYIPNGVRCVLHQRDREQVGGWWLG